MMEFVCERCEKHFFDEALPRRGSICFGCHVKTIEIGYTHGRENFHGATVAEKQKKIVADAKAAGIDAAPVGSRWV